MRPSHRRHNPMWPRRRRTHAVTVMSSVKVLKELYPQSGSAEMVRPWSYKLAKDCGWITSGAYWDVKPVPTGRTNPSIGALAYTASPLFALLKKDTDWSTTP